MPFSEVALHLHNVSSGLYSIGRLTPSWHSVYSMSKHALIALADGLRKELYKFDVGVVTIEPFYFR